MKHVAPLGLLGLLAVSCATSVITNLTPSSLPRNPTGQYLVEMKLDTRQQTLREDSVTPYVVVGFNEYKMRPTMKMKNRWETYVPAEKESLVYFFKVDYEYNRFGKPGPGSMRSPEYKLTLK